MTVVEFKSDSGSVKVNAEDMPKIAEKSKEILEKMKQSMDDVVTTQAREMARKYTISKINVTKDVPHFTTVKYYGENAKGSKETTFTGYEEMTENDYFLIQDLIPHVCEILEFPEEWEDSITVTGISLNYDIENDGALRGMVVTMQRKVNDLNCPLNINTPFIKFSAYIDEYSQFPPNEATWSNPVNAKILEIIDNTFKYMCGNTKTKQQKLFA